MVNHWWRIGSCLGLAFAAVGCQSTSRNLFTVPADWHGVALGRPSAVSHAPGNRYKRSVGGHGHIAEDSTVGGQLDELRASDSGRSWIDPSRWTLPDPSSIVSVEFVEPKAMISRTRTTSGTATDSAAAARSGANDGERTVSLPTGYRPRHLTARLGEIERGTYIASSQPPFVQQHPTSLGQGSSRRSVWSDAPLIGNPVSTPSSQPIDNTPTSSEVRRGNPQPATPTMPASSSGSRQTSSPFASGDDHHSGTHGPATVPTEGARAVTPSAAPEIRPVSPTPRASRRTQVSSASVPVGSADSVMVSRHPDRGSRFDVQHVSTNAEELDRRRIAPIDVHRVSVPLRDSTGLASTELPGSVQAAAAIEQGVFLDTTAGVTLEGVTSLALGNHPIVAEANAEIMAAQGRWRQAGLGPNPLVGFSGQQLGSNGQAEQIGVLFEQQFIRGNKLSLDQAVAARDIARAQERLIRASLQVEGRVRRAYASAVIAQRRVELVERLLGIATENERVIGVLVESREASQVEVLRARIQTQSIAAEHDAARRSLDGALASLEAAVGSALGSADQMLRLEDPYPTGPLTELDSNLVERLDSHPDLLDAIIAIEQARWKLQRECAERVSDVDVQMVLQYDESLDSPNGILQVTAPWMIRNRNQGNIQAARSDLVAAARAADRKRLEIEQSFALRISQYEAARARIARYAEPDGILDMSRRTSAMLQQSVQAGEVDLLALFLAEKERMTAEQEYLDLLEEALDRRADLETMMVSTPP